MTDRELQNLKKLVLQASGSLEPFSTDVEPQLDRLDDIRGVAFDVYGTLLVSGVGDIGLTDKEDRDPQLANAISASGLKLDPGARELHGKLRETIRTHQEAGKEKRKDLEYPEIEIREVWEDFLKQLVAENLLSGEITVSGIAEIALRYELDTNPVALMPGFPGIMAFLREKNLPVSIVSNAQFFTPLILETLLDESLENTGFDLYTAVWSYLEREAKPSRDLYQLAAEKWKAHYRLSPDKLLYIGNDMRNDIAPARKCGFKTALFAGDQRSLRLREDDPLCQGVKPDRVLTHLDQLKDLLS